MDGHFGLVVFGRGEDLTAFAGDGGVGFNELGHHTAEGFDTHREGRYVEEDDVAHAAFLVEDGTLDGSTHSHHFIGVHALGGSFAEEVLYEFLNGGDAARTTHENHFVDFVLVKAGIAEGVLAGHEASLDESVCELFELGAGEGLHKVLGHTTYGHDVGEVDFRRSRAGEFDFCLFGSFFQALHGHGVGFKVGTFIVLKFFDEPVDDHLVEVVTTEVGVAVGGEHFKHTAAKFEDRDIKRTATKVEHGNLHVLVGLVYAISESGCRRFVDDALHFKSGNLTGFLGGLALRVGEVGRHCDDGFRHFLAEVVFGGLLHLLKHHGRDFLRRIVAAVDGHAGESAIVHHLIRHATDFFVYLLEGFTHEALDGVHRAFGVGDGLALGGVAHFTLAVADESHDRRCGALAFAVGDNNRFATFKNRYARICRTEVNTNNLSHNLFICLFCYYSGCLSASLEALLLLSLQGACQKENVRRSSATADRTAEMYCGFLPKTKSDEALARVYSTIVRVFCLHCLHLRHKIL